MDAVIWAEYYKRYCNASRVPCSPLKLDRFRKRLLRDHPTRQADINEVLPRFDLEVCQIICAQFQFQLNKQGHFINLEPVRATMRELRPDLSMDTINERLRQIELQTGAKFEDQRKSALQAQASKHIISPTPKVPPAKTGNLFQNGASGSGNEKLRNWIASQYMAKGFEMQGFIGWERFEKILTAEMPDQAMRIGKQLRKVQRSGHTYTLKDPRKVEQERAAAQAGGGVQLPKAEKQAQTAAFSAIPKTQAKPAKGVPRSSVITRSMFEPHAKAPLEASTVLTNDEDRIAVNQQLQSQLRRLAISDESSNVSAVDLATENSSDDEEDLDEAEPDFSLIGKLAADRVRNVSGDSTLNGINRDIGHAPLLSEALVTQHAKNLVPQFGFLGSEHTEGRDMKVFQNTNVPFSTFICGVQGSGKSHTTACMLENALIPSPHLGRLQAPVSALVFSYSEFSNGGSGFAVSEAASLATASEAIATGRVKKVTVLTSPSNPAITKFYRAIPGVEVLPFKLKARTLDIGTLLTLMAVNEKAEVPLYMAKVESILRAIATESKDGLFDYNLFKERLALENFDPKQTNMLDMRLGLLESFLDKTNTVPDPKYRPGEVTIIDLSDPFVTPNTACILFKLGLERFMQSRVPGKMVVLDEAHKYMLNTPGSKVLNDYLATLIRLQRHKGARVVISTQEPTISTDLIALCAVTVVHRFTSPAWYAALKRHINAMDDDKDTMRQIEGLETGEALVYSPNAVLEKDFDGSLVKATGRLMKLSIRKRITHDGGESIMSI